MSSEVVDVGSDAAWQKVVDRARSKRDHSDWNCPRCGSDHTQRVAMAHAQGVTINNASGLGVVSTGNGLGIGLMGTKGTSVTAPGSSRRLLR